MIELKGVIQYHHEDHKHVHLVVEVDRTYQNERHVMGVDIDINRGKIITFLSGVYGIPPSEIVWPGHIILKEGDA